MGFAKVEAPSTFFTNIGQFSHFLKTTDNLKLLFKAKTHWHWNETILLPVAYAKGTTLVSGQLF